MHILSRFIVDDFIKFKEGFIALNNQRSKQGCLEYLLFTNPKNVVTILFEWTNDKDFINYCNSNSSIDKQLRKTSEWILLDRIVRWNISSSISSETQDEIYEFSRQSVKSYQGFITHFLERYNHEIMDGMGVTKYEIYRDMRQNDVITLLATWRDIEAYNNSDEYYKSISSIGTLKGEAEIKYVDRILLRLEASF